MSASAVLNPKDLSLDALVVKKSLVASNRLTANDATVNTLNVHKLNVSALLPDGGGAAVPGDVLIDGTLDVLGGTVLSSVVTSGDVAVGGSLSVAGNISGAGLLQTAGAVVALGDSKISSVIGNLSLGNKTNELSFARPPFLSVPVAPTISTATVLTGADVLAGVLVLNSATLAGPTAANLDSAYLAVAGAATPLLKTFPLLISNAGAGTITLTPGANTLAVLPSIVIPIGGSRLVYFTKTAATPVYGVY